MAWPKKEKKNIKFANDLLFVKYKLEEIQGYSYVTLTCIPVCFLEKKKSSRIAGTWQNYT